MTQYRFRALVTLDVPVQGGGPDAEYPGRTQSGPHHASEPHTVLVHAWHLGHPYCDRYFPAVITQDDELPLQPGRGTIVTITVNDDHALEFLDAGQQFSIWGGGGGHGIISRRVFSEWSPS